MDVKRFAKRMKKELEVFLTNPPPGIYCYTKDVGEITINCLILEAVIVGPEGTPYEGGMFHLDLIIPDAYPFFPPRVRFLTPIYHPNIDEHGRICMDLLKVPPVGAWRCTCSISNVLIAIQCLLADPNAYDPLLPDIAQQYLENREEYNKMARAHTETYANHKKLPDDLVATVAKIDAEPVTLSELRADAGLPSNNLRLVPAALDQPGPSGSSCFSQLGLESFTLAIPSVSTSSSQPATFSSSSYNPMDAMPSTSGMASASPSYSQKLSIMFNEKLVTTSTNKTPEAKRKWGSSVNKNGCSELKGDENIETKRRRSSSQSLGSPGKADSEKKDMFSTSAAVNVEHNPVTMEMDFVDSNGNEASEVGFMNASASTSDHQRSGSCEFPETAQEETPKKPKKRSF